MTRFRSTNVATTTNDEKKRGATKKLPHVVAHRVSESCGHRIPIHLSSFSVTQPGSRSCMSENLHESPFPKSQPGSLRRFFTLSTYPSSRDNDCSLADCITFPQS